MIIDEDNIRVQYESTKESPILRDDVLPYPYKYTEKDQIYVLEGTTELTREQDFTVSYDGSVTLLKDIPAGTVLTIYRSTPLDQGSEFPQEAPFSSKKIEDALDKLTMQNQEQREALSRALKLPMTASTDLTDLEMPTPEPNRSVKWNADGTALINTNFDPDTALVQTENFKKQAEQAAQEAVAAKNSITTTEEGLVNTAKQATDEITRLAEETTETIENASRYKLNSKEIGSLLFSSTPNTNSDLHKTDGSAITSEDSCWAEFHNVWAKKQRDLTDIKTTVYKYASRNYSRMWYSEVESCPDQHYGLQNVLNIPQGGVFLLDRAGNKHIRQTLSVQSYYKYELINAVGDTTPYQYLLLPIQMGTKQIEEPSKDDLTNFYIYINDVRLGANYTDITNLDILPPDVTSEYRRILITRVVAGNTYYYYYKATPVSIQAYMFGSVADLNLGGQTGVQTQDTVVRPNLITTPVDSFVMVNNSEFLTTAEFDAHKDSHEEFYSNFSDKDSDTTFKLEPLTKDFATWARIATSIPTLKNDEGWVDGFYWWHYKIPFVAHPGTKLDIVGNTVDIPVDTVEVEIQFQTAMHGNYQRVIWGDYDNTDVAGALQLGMTESTRADENGVPARNRLEWLIPNSAFNNWALVCRIPHEIKEYTKYKTKFVRNSDGTYQVFFAETDKEYEEVLTGTCPHLYFTARPNMQLGSAYNDTFTNFRGKIDMKNTSFKINGRDCISSNIKYYAKDEKGEYIKTYASNDTPRLATKPFANVYESNPKCYTLANLIEDIDGWCAPTAANCGHWYGAGDNGFIGYSADNFIDIQGRFITPSVWNVYNTMFQILRYGYAVNPFRLTHVANSRRARIAMGKVGTNWAVAETDTTFDFADNTEYFIRWYSDFSKKYTQVDSVWTEDTTGTYFKYTLTLRPWNGPEDNAEPYTWDYYTTYRFGSAQDEYYSVCGVGYDNYTLNATSYFNSFATSINGRTLFADNIHVVNRAEDSTVLPMIEGVDLDGTGDKSESYVVVANGVTEEVILASPQKQIDDYVDKEVLPEFNATMQTEIKTGLSSIQTATSQGLTKLAQASDAIRKKDCVPVSVPIYEYVSGASGYRIYSRTDLGYRCVQWGITYNQNNQWVLTQLFKKYKSTDYFLATGIESTNIGDIWGYGDRTGDKYVDSFYHYVNNSTSGNFWWRTEGFILDSEVPQGL